MNSASKVPQPQNGDFRIEVGNEGLQYTTITVGDPVPTGGQILAASGLQPVREHLLFQVLPDGILDEVRPEDLVDLRLPGKEKFLAFRGDRIYRFTMNDRSVSWGSRRITGHALKWLAGVSSADFDVVLIDPEGQNRVLGDRDQADLTESGVERFETIPVRIEIFVNTEPRVVHRRVMTYWEIVRLEYPQANPDCETEAYTVTYAKGPRENPSGSLVKGQSVHLKQAMEFDVFLTDRS